MDPVAFLLEETGERLPCLLNPPSLVARRSAGLRPRGSIGGALTGAGQADDPLLYTGGGRMELELDLLFDVALVGPHSAVEDVRDLTAPLWHLAENMPGEDGYGRPPRVRFIWGKSWNVPGVVAAVAERLEHFAADGTPRRSWLRMRFLRVAEPPAKPAIANPARRARELSGAGTQSDPDLAHTHLTLVGERLDLIAARYGGDASQWRWIAEVNQVDDPLRLEPGRVLSFPPLA